MSPIWIYLIIAFVIAAFVIAIVALVQSNNNKDDIKTLQNQSVNYTALNTGNTKLENGVLAAATPTKAIVITLPTDKWAYTNANLGVLGNIYVTTTVQTNIQWVVKYTKNGGPEEFLAGAVDNTTAQEFLVNLNGVASGDNGIIKNGDVIVLNIYATAAAPTTINNDPDLFDAAIVYGPLNISS